MLKMSSNSICTFLLLTISLKLIKSTAATDKVLCYYEAWDKSYDPDEIDLDICTHINYSFLGINENGTLRLDETDDFLRTVSNLKSKNPNVKLIFSVGGWAEGSTGFSIVAGDPAKKVVMAESALWYLENYDFDGIDIDWEYPGKRGGNSKDKENFIDMLSTLRNRLKENGDYLLTVAVCADPDCGDYDITAISKIVDYINVMTYDLHSSDDGKTGQNSPLYASSTDSEWEKTHANCDAAISNWLERGASPDQLILGLGFYGKGYTLANPEKHGVGAPTIGGGKLGAYSYDKICSLTEGWTEEWDEEQQNPYKYSGDQWIGYDNPKSIGIKVQYAKKRNLGGVMMWALNEDDIDGSCGVKNALLQAIKNNL